MRAWPGSHDDAGGAASDAGARPRSWVITLSLSSAPLPLEPPVLPHVGGLTVFRARRVHAGGEQHLQQLGYFESREAAEAILSTLAMRYPGAIVEPAPEKGMGSMDDTLIGQFEVLRGPSQAPTAPDSEFQFYAIQLLRQATPIDLARIARPVLFQGYTLYRVQSERNGFRTHGLRLGFFPDQYSAKIVAHRVHSLFPQSAVVPVSEREFTRASARGG